jgi:hypothetical protein
MMQGYYAYRDDEWVPTLDPKVKIVTQGRKTYVTLLERIRYVDVAGVPHDAEAGFVCDGGSKPRWTWVLMGHPLGRYLMAYIIHDKGYDNLRKARFEGFPLESAEILRKYEDALFLQGMRWIKRQSQFGMARNAWHRIKARLKHNAVRVAGRFVIDWKQNN